MFSQNSLTSVYWSQLSDWKWSSVSWLNSSPTQSQLQHITTVWQPAFQTPSKTGQQTDSGNKKEVRHKDWALLVEGLSLLPLYTRVGRSLSRRGPAACLLFREGKFGHGYPLSWTGLLFPPSPLLRDNHLGFSLCISIQLTPEGMLRVWNCCEQAVCDTVS